MRAGWNKFYQAVRSHRIIASATALVLIAVGYILIGTNASDIFTTWRTEATGTARTPAGDSVTPSATDAAGSEAPSPLATASASGRDWPSFSNTGIPAGVSLRDCAPTITRSGTYDACEFNGDVVVKANNVKITRSLIYGAVSAGSGSQQSGLVISDTTIDCRCLADNSHTPSAIMESNYTLLRVNLYNSGHGAAVRDNVVIQDSYIHGLGGNTDAHKDGIYSGDGTNVLIRNNTIECNDGPRAGCTAAIGLLTDFADISHYTIDHNLLNTIGSYCFYGSGGPQKRYISHHITFTNNHFGRAIYPKCGYYGPVTYFDLSQPGNVWSGNVWDDTGAPVDAAN